MKASRLTRDRDNHDYVESEAATQRATWSATWRGVSTSSKTHASFGPIYPDKDGRWQRTSKGLLLVGLTTISKWKMESFFPRSNMCGYPFAEASEIPLGVARSHVCVKTQNPPTGEVRWNVKGAPRSSRGDGRCSRAMTYQADQLPFKNMRPSVARDILANIVARRFLFLFESTSKNSVSLAPENMPR